MYRAGWVSSKVNVVPAFHRFQFLLAGAAEYVSSDFFPQVLRASGRFNRISIPYLISRTQIVFGVNDRPVRPFCAAFPARESSHRRAKLRHRRAQSFIRRSQVEPCEKPTRPTVITRTGERVCREVAGVTSICDSEGRFRLERNRGGVDRRKGAARKLTMSRMIVLLLAAVAFVAAEDSKTEMTAVVHLVPHDVHVKNVTGYLTISQSSDGKSVRVTGMVYGLTEGLHGFHVHEKGDMRQGCTSTGAHFNPENVTHGAPGDKVRHVGDLGNIRANSAGEAFVNITDDVISFHGKNNILGRAFVVHSGEDDLGLGNTTLSSTTGNAGDRWACGIIGVLQL
ncbi:hypothetical protein KM043_014769 [Ampulex compressa]|nr:hypothetical protein KM043_014769 [Ampulex compressa]